MAETIVLVHGFWHGGWAWEKLVQHLREQGHYAHAPTLAGHGEDTERAGISHRDYVDSVVGYLEAHGLRDVVLVGHSFGGTVISKVAERAPDRVKRLVFWNAFVLEDGQCFNDNIPGSYIELFEELVQTSEDNTVTMPWEIWRDVFMQDASETEARDAWERLTPEPYRPFTERLDLGAFYSLDIPKSYVHCRQDASLPPGSFHPGMSSRLGEFRLVEMDGSHEALFTRPAELATSILQASNG